MRENGGFFARHWPRDHVYMSSFDPLPFGSSFQARFALALCSVWSELGCLDILRKSRTSVYIASTLVSLEIRCIGELSASSAPTKTIPDSINIVAIGYD